MGYFKLGDMVWVKSEITEIIEKKGSTCYKLHFHSPTVAYSDVIMLEKDLIEKAEAEKCCSTGDDMDKESIQ